MFSYLTTCDDESALMWLWQFIYLFFFLLGFRIWLQISWRNIKKIMKIQHKKNIQCIVGCNSYPQYFLFIFLVFWFVLVIWLFFFSIWFFHIEFGDLFLLAWYRVLAILKISSNVELINIIDLNQLKL